MTAKGGKAKEKGAAREELVAKYFRNAGYYVVRAVPFEYGQYEVTDIDLWLYLKSSAVTREISIVDVKNKRTPQAIERIFWTKGLQSALGVTRAMVATSDSREEVRAFGRELDVVVLDGAFLKRLERSETGQSRRQTEDAFESALRNSTLGRLDGDWRGRMRECKARLAPGIEFDSINLWAEHAHFFAEQLLTRNASRALARSCLYRILSYVAIGVDYFLKDAIFLDASSKEERLKDGFRYGSRGRAGLDETIDTSLALMEKFGGTVSSASIRSQLAKELDALPVEGLSEYLARGEVGKKLFALAKSLDEHAMYGGESDSVDVRSFLGCFVDYWGYKRTLFEEFSHNKTIQQTSEDASG